MGLTSGFLFAKFGDDKPDQLNLKAQKFMKTIPGQVLTDFSDLYTKMNQVITEIEMEAASVAAEQNPPQPNLVEQQNLQPINPPALAAAGPSKESSVSLMSNGDYGVRADLVQSQHS